MQPQRSSKDQEQGKKQKEMSQGEQEQDPRQENNAQKSENDGSREGEIPPVVIGDLKERQGRATERTSNFLQHGVITFFAFVIAGFVPLFPYVFSLGDAQTNFVVASILAALTFFVVGAARTILTGGNPLKAGTEILLIGGFASGVAFFIGWGVKTLFGIVV